MSNTPYFTYTDQRNKKTLSQNKNMSNYLNFKGNDNFNNFNEPTPFHYVDSNENLMGTKNNLRISKTNKIRNNNSTNNDNKDNLIDLLEQKYQKDKKNKSTISSENSSENPNITTNNNQYFLNNTNEDINIKELVYTKKAIRKNCSIQNRKTNEIMKAIYCNLDDSKESNENKIGSNINNLNINTTFFSTTPTEQELVDMDRIILEKGASLRNDFFNQIFLSNGDYIFNKTVKDLRKPDNDNMELKDDNDNERNTNTINHLNSKGGSSVSSERKKNLLNNKLNAANFKQEDLKNNILNLLEFYSLLTQKIKIISRKNMDDKYKYEENREKFFYEIKKLDKIVQKDKLFEIKKHIHVNSNSFLNEKLINPLLKIKKAESKIFQNIFNVRYYEYDILKFKEKEKEKLFDEQNIVQLLLTLINNIILITGNVSQVYKQTNETLKFQYFKSLLGRYNINEKNEGQPGFLNFNNLNSFIGIHKDLFLNKKNKNKSVVDDDIKVIKEVEEDKEDDEGKDSDKNEEKNKEIDKILLEEFPKKYKCKFNFIKKDKNEYTFNDINIHAYFDEEDDQKLIFKVNSDKEIEYEKFISEYIDKENKDDKEKKEHNQKETGSKLNLNMNSNIYRRKIRSKKYIINSDNQSIKQASENKNITEITETKENKKDEDNKRGNTENTQNQNTENLNKENIETKNENEERDKKSINKM